MSNTLSTMSIGFVGNTKGLMGPVEEAIGGVGRLAQTAGGLLVPAFSQVNSASSQAEVGMGRLEHLIEVLGLRVLATSTQISNLAQSSRRMGQGQRDSARGVSQATDAMQQEAVVARNLSETLSTLTRQSAVRSRNAGKLQVINEDQEISKIQRLRTEMRLLSEQQARESVASRIGSIGNEMRTLSAERENPNLPGSRQIEISERLQALASERLQLDIQLRHSVDQRSDASTEIVNKHEQINALLAQSQRMISEESRIHKQSLNAKSAAASPGPPQNLILIKREMQSIRSQVKKTEIQWRDINEEMKTSVGDESRLLALEQDRNRVAEKLAHLRQKESVAFDAVLQGNKQAAGIEEQIAASLLQQRAVSKPKLAAEAKVTREKKEHRALLMEAVRLQKMTVQEAERLARKYDKLANKNLKKVNANIDSVVKGNGRMNFAIQQFGFGVEDAATQFGTRGLAGAIGAASNNLTAMVGVLARNPFTLVAASMGVALAQLAIQTGALESALDALGFSSEAQKKRNEDLEKSFDKVADAEIRAMENAKALREIQEEDSSKAALKNMEKLQFERKKLEIQQRADARKQQAIDDRARLKTIGAEQLAVKMSLADRTSAAIEERGSVSGDEVQRMRLDIAREVKELEEEEFQIRKRLNGAVQEGSELFEGMKARQEEINVLREQEAAQAERLPEVRAAELAIHNKKMDAVKLDLASEIQKQEALKISITMADELQANADRRVRLQKELNALIASQGGTEEEQIANAKKRLSVRKEITATFIKENQLNAKGDAEASKAEDILSRAKERAGAAETEDERRNREHGKFVESLEKAVSVQSITLKQQKEALAQLDKIHAKEKRSEALEKKKKELKEQIKATSKTPTVGTAVEGGSAEAGSILNQAILDGFSETAQEPLVEAMHENAEEIKKVAAAVKAIQILNLKKK